MSKPDVAVPDQLPLLSRGKHRNPRRGACFMELASYLAGERWSDHPACTHPLLAALARNVNDCTTDAGRHHLAVLIPSVIGLTGDDARIDARIALMCARTALPIVAADRQRVMAVSALSCERVLADIEGRPEGSLEDETVRALAQAPHAARWARGFVGRIRASSRSFQRYGAPSIVSTAVPAIARALVPDPDAILRELLESAIDECAAAFRPADEPATVDLQRWDDACRLAGPVTR